MVELIASAMHVPEVRDDPWTLENLANPLPLQERVRDTAPLVWLSSHGLFATGRYDLVYEGLTNWQALESGAGVGLMNKRKETPWRPQSLLIEADPPQHDAPHSVVSKVIGPRALRRLRVEWMNAAERHVESVLGDATTVELDGAVSLARAYPLMVFPDAVGLPKEGREHLLPYSDHAFNTHGPHNDLVARGEQTISEHATWINEHCARTELAQGSIGMAIWEAVDREEILPSQAPLLVRSLLTAGVDTSINGIGALLLALASNPDQWQLLRNRPSLSRIAFDESVRWQSPVQVFARTARCDVELGNEVVPEGKKVLLMLGAANRDPRRWSDPDKYDLTRDPSGHVGFGMGLHQCLGQHIARLESEALLNALIPRIARIELTGEPEWHLNNTLRGLSSLPLRIETSR